MMNSAMFFAWSPMRSIALAMNSRSRLLEIVRASSIMYVMSLRTKPSNSWSSRLSSFTIATAAAGYANVEETAKYDARNPGALKRLVAGGTQLRPFSNEVLEASLKATNTLWAEISAKNPDFKKSIDAMQAYRGDEYLWWQVAEYTFDSFQIRSRTRG